jgi:hypothetical protein
MRYDKTLRTLLVRDVPVYLGGSLSKWCGWRKEKALTVGLFLEYWGTDSQVG